LELLKNEKEKKIYFYLFDFIFKILRI